MTRRETLGLVCAGGALLCGAVALSSGPLARRAFAAEQFDSAEVLPVNYTDEQLGQAEALMRDMIAGLETSRQDAALSRLTVACVRQAFRTINEDPEYYYLDGTLHLEYFDTEGDENDCPVNSVQLSYIVSEQDFHDYAARFEQGVCDALSWVSPSMDVVEAAKALHDYLIRFDEYDTQVEQTRDTSDREPYSAYGALVNATAVCDGYAHAYELLLSRLGFQAGFVSSDEMNHSWNMVGIDQDWYHVDVTWDDPVPDQGSDAPVTAACFLRSDASMEELGHYDWEADHVAGSDYDWRASYGDLEYSGPASADVAVADPYRFLDVSFDDELVKDGVLDAIVDAGIMGQGASSGDGTPTGWFHPGSYVSREQLAAILYRTAEAWVRRQGGSEHGAVTAPSGPSDAVAQGGQTLATEGTLSAGGGAGADADAGSDAPRTRDSSTLGEGSEPVDASGKDAGASTGDTGSELPPLDGDASALPADVDETSYAAAAIAWCIAAGVMDAQDEGQGERFLPDRSVTREELARHAHLLAQRLLPAGGTGASAQVGRESTGLASCADRAAVGSDLSDDVEWALGVGALRVTSIDGLDRVMPVSWLTRAAAARAAAVMLSLG